MLFVSRNSFNLLTGMTISSLPLTAYIISKVTGNCFVASSIIKKSGDALQGKRDLSLIHEGENFSHFSPQALITIDY